MLTRSQIKVLMAFAGLKDREEGQALVEYALIISLIAIVAIGALTLTGQRVTSIINTIANAL
jgi:pilus assembly protein Flp/PilA